MDETIYKLLLWIVPILLSVLSYVGVMVVSWLRNISKSLEEMNIKVERFIVKHDNLEERVDKIEHKLNI